MKIENKILNIHIQQEHISSLTTAFPLCMLLSDEKHKGWYYEHYIKLFSCLNYESSFECNFLDSLDYSIGGFWDTRLIRFSYIPSYIMNDVKCIHLALKQYINNDAYCILFVDEYQIVNLSRNYHFAHEVLIYGYSDNKKIYYALAFKDKKFTDILISYKELESGYKEAFQYIHERGGWEQRMFMQFRPVQHMTDYPFSITKFVSNLKEYLNSKYSDRETYFSLFDERELDCPEHKVKEGVSVELDFIEYLKRLREDLEDKKQDVILRYTAFHNLRDHKKMLFTRLKYIEKIYSNADIEHLIFAYKKVVEKCEIIRLLYLKIKANLFKKDFNKALSIVDKLIFDIQEVFAMEKYLLNSIVLAYTEIILNKNM